MTNIIFSHEQSIQQELTKRPQADMSSDSRMSNNILPVVQIFVLGMYSFFSLANGNRTPSFEINQNYVELLGK